MPPMRRAAAGEIPIKCLQHRAHAQLPKPTPRSAATDLTLLPEIVEVIAAPEPAVEAATAPAPVVVETHRTKPEPAEAAADAQDETALAPEDEFSDDLPPVLTDED